MPKTEIKSQVKINKAQCFRYQTHINAQKTPH